MPENGQQLYGNGHAITIGVATNFSDILKIN